MAAILLLALGVRCIYLSSHTRVVDQSNIHLVLAHNILAGHWFATLRPVGFEQAGRTSPPAGMSGAPAGVSGAPAGVNAQWKPWVAEVVGPGVALAAVWAVTGSERAIYSKVLLIAIDLGMVLLIYRIAMLLFRRRRAATIAAALYALCFPIARQTSIYDPDIWGVYFTVAIFDLYLEALHSPAHRWRWLLACGLLTGVGVFFRPNVLLLAPALGLASVRWPGVRRPLAGACAVPAIAALMLIPWTIRNYEDFHRFIPVRSGSGMVLWQGLGELHNDFGAVDDDWATWWQVHRVRPDLEYLSPAYDEYLRKRAVHAIEQNPLFYAKLVGYRIAATTAAVYESAWMYHGGESPVAYRARTGAGPLSYVVHRPLELLESLFEPAIFVLAMLVMILTWRSYRREHLLLIALVLSALIPYWLLHVEARYALPTLPAYLILIALGAELLGERVVRRRRGSLTPVRAPRSPPAPARNR